MAVIARESSKICIPNHPPYLYNDQIISVVLISCTTHLINLKTSCVWQHTLVSTIGWHFLRQSILRPSGYFQGNPVTRKSMSISLCPFPFTFWLPLQRVLVSLSAGDDNWRYLICFCFTFTIDSHLTFTFLVKFDFTFTFITDSYFTFIIDF